MTEELLQDLAEYKTYKDKGVMMASRSLIALFRSLAPELLHKKDRGRPTEATTLAKMKQFGESDVVDFIAGAEVLGNEESEEENEEEDNESGDGEDSEDEDEDEDEEVEGEATDKKDDVMTLEEKTQKARDATVGRILSDDDFRKIAAAQLRKQVEGVRKPKKTPKKGVKRTASEANIDDDWNDDDEEATGREELVNLDAIEMIHKKKRHDKEARLATVIAGREGREKFGHISKKGTGASLTNKQKAKKKNFSMMKHKIKTKGKKSFREKQQALKKRLIKSQKFK